MKIGLVVLLVGLLAFGLWFGLRSRGAKPEENVPQAAKASASPVVAAINDEGATSIYAHNLMLRQGPDFRVYVRWLRGELGRTQKTKIPSLDDTDSFFLYVKNGVLRANIGDLEHFLNSGGLGDSPLKNVSIVGDGTRVTLKGTLHKVVPLPVQITGDLSVLSGHKVKLTVTKIEVLKIPFKFLLGMLHLNVADLAGSGGKKVPGIELSGNNIIFDTQQLLPPPHIRGELTTVRIVNPDLEAVYGNTQADLERVEQWRNYLHLKGGSLTFGKLTMHQVDLIMIDISNDAWFDLDLTHYETQLVNGYTRMTPDAALQIFMPDLSQVGPGVNTNVNLEFMKNRNAPIPKSVTQH